jgi:hypothetical protein
MDAGVIIVALGMIAFGAWLMHRLDNYLKKEFPPQEETTPQTLPQQVDVLLYGDRTVTEQVKQCLEDSGLHCQQITQTHLPSAVDFRAILAVSGDDRDNLILCNEAQHRNPQALLVARCSYPPFRDIYTQAHVKPLLTEEPMEFFNEIGEWFDRVS